MCYARGFRRAISCELNTFRSLLLLTTYLTLLFLLLLTMFWIVYRARVHVLLCRHQPSSTHGGRCFCRVYSPSCWCKRHVILHAGRPAGSIVAVYIAKLHSVAIDDVVVVAVATAVRLMYFFKVHTLESVFCWISDCAVQFFFISSHTQYFCLVVYVPFSSPFLPTCTLLTKYSIRRGD